MHPISSTLAVMVERTTAKAQQSAELRGDPRDLERAVYRALADLDRTRPRMVAFAPAKALKRVLTHPEVRHYLGARGETDDRRGGALSMQGSTADAEGALSMRVFLIVAIGFALVASTLHGDEAAAAKAKLRNVTRSATVAESGAIDVDSAGAAITGGAFVFANVGKIRRIDQLTVTVTIGDGDTGPGDPKENLLSLALDGVDTGIALNGFRDSETDTRTISGVPTNAAQILAALKADGRLNATILDADPNGNLVTLPANADTTLVVKGKQKGKKR